MFFRSIPSLNEKGNNVTENKKVVDSEGDRSNLNGAAVTAADRGITQTTPQNTDKKPSGDSGWGSTGKPRGSSKGWG